MVSREQSVFRPCLVPLTQQSTLVPGPGSIYRGVSPFLTPLAVTQPLASVDFLWSILMYLCGGGGGGGVSWEGGG